MRAAPPRKLPQGRTNPLPLRGTGHQQLLIHDSTRSVIGLLNLARAGSKPKTSSRPKTYSKNALHRCGVCVTPAPAGPAATATIRERSTLRSGCVATSSTASHEPIEAKRPLQDCKNYPTLNSAVGATQASRSSNHTLPSSLHRQGHVAVKRISSPSYDKHIV